jgi:hypothetical protein
MRLSHALSKFSDAGAEATCESAIQPCRSLCEAMSSNHVSQATQQQQQQHQQQRHHQQRMSQRKTRHEYAVTEGKQVRQSRHT